MKRLGLVTALLLLCTLVGCKKKEQYVLLVNHYLHVTENELECDFCHEKNEKGEFTKPGHKVCNECHDDVIQTKTISVKTCGYCHKQRNLEAIKALPPVRAKSRAFVHTAALEGRCNECHKGLMAKGLKQVQLLSRSDVVALRDAAHAADKTCDDCHVGMDPKVEPSSHDKSWVRVHGMRAENDPALCAACHQEETCRECHETTKPASHNTLWRLKTHGIHASWDRSRCQTCHEEDFCVACHAETRPRSHNASWKSTHCFECHTSQADGTGCSTCHEASPDAHPNPHAAGWVKRHCNHCHQGTAEGDTCLLCHPGGVGAHPNPHGGGWQDRHCASCHPDNADSKQCSVCHRVSISSHPNPHKAGWRKSHCVTCHFDDTRRQEECALCHENGASVHVHDYVWVGDLADHQLFVTETTDCFLCH